MRPQERTAVDDIVPFVRAPLQNSETHRAVREQEINLMSLVKQDCQPVGPLGLPLGTTNCADSSTGQ